MAISFVQVLDQTFFERRVKLDNVALFVRVHPSIKEALEKDAKDKGMSIALTLENILARELNVSVEGQLTKVTRAAGYVA